VNAVNAKDKLASVRFVLIRISANIRIRMIAGGRGSGGRKLNVNSYHWTKGSANGNTL
jgi:hypothetical protein